MNWENYLYPTDEKPLERLVEGYSNTSIFRTIAFVGDSMSSGEFETCDENGEHGFYDLFEYSFGQHIARKNGLTAHSFSRGGMTAREYINGYAEEKGFWDPQKAAQAYVIALGYNDLVCAKMDVGSTDDIDPADHKNNDPTFAGYYAAIVARYKEIAPDAKFFFMTFPKTGDQKLDSVAEKHAELLYSLAGYYENCYVIDMFRNAPIFDEAFKERFFMYGHMNPMGYLLIAKMLDSYIDYIIRHNSADFKTAGFINTDVKYK